MDEAHIHAVGNQTVVKIDEATGGEVARWEGPEEGPLLHLGCAVTNDGLLCAALPDDPDWLTTSFMEVRDPAPLEPLTHARVTRGAPSRSNLLGL